MSKNAENILKRVIRERPLDSHKGDYSIQTASPGISYDCHQVRPHAPNGRFAPDMVIPKPIGIRTAKSNCLNPVAIFS